MFVADITIPILGVILYRSSRHSKTVFCVSSLADGFVNDRIAEWEFMENQMCAYYSHADCSVRLITQSGCFGILYNSDSLHDKFNRILYTSAFNYQSKSSRCCYLIS